MATINNGFVDMHIGFGLRVLHAAISAVFVALFLIAINALFERRGGKYISNHFGYWFITLPLMGDILC